MHVYVAMAPTYQECDEDDLRATMKALRDHEPLTSFHEPINLRADNVVRIAEAAFNVGLRCRPKCSRLGRHGKATPSKHSNPSGDPLGRSELHLWPDKALGSKQVLASNCNPKAHLNWLPTLESNQPVTQSINRTDDEKG